VAETLSTGTAFVVHSEGLLLTCFHVVKDAGRVEVSLGGRKYRAAVVGTDPKRDLALLQIDASGLPALPWVPAPKVELGEEVRAFGFPLTGELGRTLKVTRGTVSGVEREAGEPVFQIDTVINPGNSGGPLVNDRGEVVGVVVARFVDAQGVGYVASIDGALPLLRGVEPLPGGQSQVRFEGPALVRQVSPSVGLVLVQPLSETGVLPAPFRKPFPTGRSAGPAFPAVPVKPVEPAQPLPVSVPKPSVPSPGTGTLDTPGAPGTPAKPVEPKPTVAVPVSAKPVEPQPAETKVVEPKPAEPKPAEPKAVEPKAVEPKPAEPKPAMPKPLEPKSVELRPADTQPSGEPTKPMSDKPASPKPAIGTEPTKVPAIDVDAELNKLRAEDPPQFPEAVAEACGSKEERSEWTIANITSARLVILIRGAEKHVVTIEPGKTATVLLLPGKYEVGGKLDVDTISPFYGMQEFTRGSRYRSRFRIELQ
jgi:hypothetical protein